MRKDFDRNLLMELGYEPRDVSFKGITVALLTLVGFLIVSIFFTLWLYTWFKPEYEEVKKLRAFVTRAKAAPHPRIQGNPRRDMQDFHMAEDARGALVAEAKASMAAEGISGVTQNAEPPAEKTSFPGSGDYEANPTPLHGGGH